MIPLGDAVQGAPKNPTEEQARYLEEIADILGAKGAKRCKPVKDIWQLARHYMVSREFHDTASAPYDVRGHVDAFIRACTKLEKTIYSFEGSKTEPAASAARRAIIDAYREHVDAGAQGYELTNLLIQLEHLKFQLKHLKRASKITRKDFPKGKRKPDQPFEDAVIGLAEIFEETVGRKPGASTWDAGNKVGPLIKCVRSFMELTGNPDKRSNETLSKAVQRVLKNSTGTNSAKK